MQAVDPAHPVRPRHRRVLASVAVVLATAVTLSACSSSSTARRTVTQTITAGSSGSGPVSTPSAGSVTVTVPGGGTEPSGSSASGSSTPSVDTSGSSASTGTTESSVSSSESSSATTSQTSSGPTKNVNPLTLSNCGAVLSPADVKTIFGKTISSKTTFTKFGAQPNISSTGAIRCAFGLVGTQQKASMKIVQYSTVAAADQQMAITVSSEKGAGAKISQVTVGGQPATVMLRSGGLVNVRYGTWVLAVAAVNGMPSGDQAGQMTKLADLVLSKVLALVG